MARLKLLPARFVVSALLVLFLPGGTAQSTPLAQLDENQLRLLEVQLGPHPLGEVIPAYQEGPMILLPLTMLSRILGLAIEGHPESGMAQGFILKEERRFLLDVARSEVTVNGIRQTFERERLRLHPDDIYVDSALLAEWFPLRLDIDLLVAKIHVRTDEPFPYQQRVEREKRNEVMERRTVKRRDYPLYREPYHLADVPFVDHTLALTSTHSDAGSQADARYTAFGTGDLLFMESSWYVSVSDEEGLDDYRLTLGRSDPGATLLGAAHARQYAFGHVSNPSVNLVATPQLPQPGVVVSNYPLGQPLQFDTHTFQGDLPPGWDVELYHNNTLIGYAQSSADGQYRFAEVPLLFGNNHFRLVFYGPQGQRREETTTYILGHSLIRPGEHYYRVFSHHDETGGDRSSLQYDFGLSRHFSASLSAVALPFADRDRRYLAMGARSFWNTFFFRLDSVQEQEGGQAQEIGLQTRIGGVNLSVSDAHLRDFTSDVFPLSGDLISRRTKARLDFALPAARWLPRIPIALELKQDTHESGRRLTEYSKRISAAANGIAVTNRVTWRTVTASEDRVDGALQLSFQRRRYGVRGELFYVLEPEDELSAIVLTVEGRQLGDYGLSFGINRSFTTDDYEYLLGVNKRQGPFGYSIDASYSTDGETALYLTLSASTTRDPRTGAWYSDAKPMAAGGAFSARAFLDQNTNGHFDEGEEVLEGVGYTFNGGYRPMASSDDASFLTGLPAHQSIDLSLASHTLEDPSWMPAREGVNTVLRPGHVTHLEFPVVMSGEIDGVVYIRRGKKEVPIGGVELELTDESGAVIQTARSAYDGFYLFSALPLGRYLVRVSAQQAARLELVQPPKIPVEITMEEFIAGNINLVLSSR